MGTTKNKRMTAREKAERAKARERLRAEGILPPRKKPLNRKKFCEEAVAEMDVLLRQDMTGWIYLVWGLRAMLLPGVRSSEAVGAAKAIRIAKRRHDFETARKHEGGKYEPEALIEAIKDVYNA